MSNSGGTVGTPIGGGVPAPIAGTRMLPLPFTLLSLNNFAKLLGINPVHFFGATTSLNPVVFPVSAQCDEVWYQYSWQDSDKVSRYDVALEIHNAERDLFKALGYFPAPVWVHEEKKNYPRPYAREYFGTGRDIRNLYKSINAQSGYVIETGRRAVTLIASATTGEGSLSYNDNDSDGFYETAVVAVTTTETDINKLKVYVEGQEGIENWEIREPRKKYISGGVAYFVFDSWLFIEPTLYEWMPTDEGASAIDISTTNNFVDTVEVYKEYADMSEPSAEFYWENENVYCAVCGGAGCDACGQVTQDGCLQIRDPRTGMVVPIPANYDSDDEEWDFTTWTGTREPDWVSLWYRAGKISEEYKRGLTTEPLSLHLAQAIAWITISRLERPICGCSKIQAVSERMQEDVTRNTRERTFFTPQELLHNPFGTRYGELQAWRRISKSVEKHPSYAII